MPNERLERLCKMLDNPSVRLAEFGSLCVDNLPALATEWAEMQRRLSEYESSMTIQLVRDLRQQLAEREREREHCNSSRHCNCHDNIERTQS